ncbi:MAG: DNA cytosine methyltransferase [Planctomycetaceae bacterium]|nr:DNA cytosine methyltransferase [Planctomycetaceae bacterium]
MVAAPKCLDLFSGIGGLSIGLERAGFHSPGGVDVWDDAAKTFGAGRESSSGPSCPARGTPA